MKYWASGWGSRDCRIHDCYETKTLRARSGVLFETVQPPGNPGRPAGLAAPLRQAGLTRFEELGLPTLKHEDWRFTNIAPVAKLPFKPAFEVTDGLGADQLAGLIFAGLPGSRLVFVDGQFSPKLSVVRNLPDGVKVGSLAAALTTEAAFVEQHLGRVRAAGGEWIRGAQSSLLPGRRFCSRARRPEGREPIQLVYVATGKQSGAAFHPRNLVVAGPNSRATILESYVSVGGAGYCTNAVTELSAGDQAHLEWVKFQDEATDAFHLAAWHGEFGRASRVWVHSLALGAKLSRNDIRVKLAGEGLECVLNGLYLTREEQLADHHMVVEHAQPQCASHEYFNGILDDKSRGVFHGRILVRPVAQKTDAKQTNKNLLLSDDASANTKPQLEIYADDVKCTHAPRWAS